VQDKDRTEKALSSFLRPEFINRVDEIITFRRLDVVDFERIAGLMLGNLKEAMSEKGISLSYTDRVISLIAKESYSEKFGARNMRRYIEKSVEDKIATVIIDNYPDKILGMHLTVDNGEITVKSI
jgi:ATP-dependent Clp protease ATP-binding subunit ClpB